MADFANERPEEGAPPAEAPPAEGGNSDFMAPDGEIDSNWDEVIETFDGMELREELLRGIYAFGFEKPSAIQQRAIRPILLGNDVIAQAQSGTGKTATFAISVLQKVDPAIRQCQALVLAPTHELAQQIVKVVDAFVGLHEHQRAWLRAARGVRDDIRTLQNGVHVVVGTPGRVFDMINRRALRIDALQLFILDEADEMLSRGFKEQIHDVFKFLPETVQVALFSATMPLDVLEVTTKFMREPIRILVKRDGAHPGGHQAVLCGGGARGVEAGHASDLYTDADHHPGHHLLQHGAKVDWLTEKMTEAATSAVSAMHGTWTSAAGHHHARSSRRAPRGVLITTDLLAGASTCSRCRW
ncbi:unnamed protein product [Heterosigma akashiwo]